MCLKLLPRSLASSLPIPIKTEAAFHLTANLAYPLMVLLSLLMFPAMVIRYNMGWIEMLLIDVPLFLGATTSVCSFYALSQKQAFPGPSWWRRLKYVPGVLALGIGLSVNNAKAVLEGLLGRQSEFVRTPKLGVEAATDEWRQKRYRGVTNWVPYVELTLGLYFTEMAFYALTHGLWGSLPFIVIFQAGYLYTAALSLIEEFERMAPARVIEA